MISDLDDLVLSCRSEVARSQMREAVACYRAGAFRSAIIATWVAVLFDFISKLRELEMSGDKKAAQKLAEFDTARKSSDVKASLDFERDLVESAKDEFELLSPVEAVDMQRLLDDRNRCAHSTMASSDAPYAPSGELVRAHIKAAVSLLLEQPPVQGKAALEQIFKDIKSEYFPTDEDNAYAFLRSGPMARARGPLIRSVTIGVTKDLLTEFRAQPERGRQFAALRAIGRMYPQESKSALAEILPIKIASVDDEHFHLVIRFVANIDLAWGIVGEAAQLRAKTSVQTAAQEELKKFHSQALRVPALRSEAILRLDELPPERVVSLARMRPDPAVLPRVLQFLSTAGSFRFAESILEALVLHANLLSGAELLQIARDCKENSQVSFAFRTPKFLEDILKNSQVDDVQATEAWKSIYALCSPGDSFEEERGTSLAAAITSRFGFPPITPAVAIDESLDEFEMPSEEEPPI